MRFAAPPAAGMVVAGRSAALRSFAANLGFAVRRCRRGISSPDFVRFITQLMDVLSDLGDEFRSGILAGIIDDDAPAAVRGAAPLLAALASPVSVQPSTQHPMQQPQPMQKLLDALPAMLIENNYAVAASVAESLVQQVESRVDKAILSLRGELLGQINLLRLSRGARILGDECRSELGNRGSLNILDNTAVDDTGHAFITHLGRMNLLSCARAPRPCSEDRGEADLSRRR